MILAPLFDAFLAQSPISVMARATIQHALNPEHIDQLFDKHSKRTYTKELLFSTTVDIMALVVSNKDTRVKSAVQKVLDRVPVKLTNVYEKLKHVEIGVSEQLVRHTATRCDRLIRDFGGTCQPLLPGYRVRILDGNHFAATDRRIEATRGRSAGPLPGQALAVLDPSTKLITDVFLCEDGHAQERSLLWRVLPLAAAGDVWLADRNFCTTDFLVGLSQRGAGFVIRRHGNLTVETEGDYGKGVATESGHVSEVKAWVCRDGERVLGVRLLRVRLEEPGEEGETEVEILTNLDAKAAGTLVASELYRDRWKIEKAFHALAVTLKCEVNTLGYPKAAGFAFGVAVCAYNVQAVIQAALRAVHGEEKVEREVSGFYIGQEWAAVYAGMMIALPEEEWVGFGEMPSAGLAKLLLEWAARIDLRKIKKSPPRPKTKNPTPRKKDTSPHVSTARVIEEAKLKKPKTNRKQ